MSRPIVVFTKEYPSNSTPGKRYTAQILADGRTQCNCPGWTKRSARTCKHTVDLDLHYKSSILKVEGTETGRTPAPLPAAPARSLKKFIRQLDRKLKIGVALALFVVGLSAHGQSAGLSSVRTVVDTFGNYMLYPTTCESGTKLVGGAERNFNGNCFGTEANLIGQNFAAENATSATTRQKFRLNCVRYALPLLGVNAFIVAGLAVTVRHINPVTCTKVKMDTTTFGLVLACIGYCIGLLWRGFWVVPFYAEKLFITLTATKRTTLRRILGSLAAILPILVFTPRSFAAGTNVFPLIGPRLLEKGSAVVTVTAYCNNYNKGCQKCCGKWAAFRRTASGVPPVQGVTVAASRSIPFGTKVHIEGVGMRVVQDRLAKKYDQRVDVYFDSHEAALKFGKQTLKVTIYEKAP